MEAKGGGRSHSQSRIASFPGKSSNEKHLIARTPDTWHTAAFMILPKGHHWIITGKACCVTPTFSGVPKQGDKIKNGYLTPHFSGAHKWAEVLNNPCILGVSQTRGQKQQWLPHPCILGHRDSSVCSRCNQNPARLDGNVKGKRRANPHWLHALNQSQKSARMDPLSICKTGMQKACVR